MATAFISFSHKDDTFREALEIHLAPLRRDGLLSVWHDRRIEPGTEWQGQIDAALETADLILLLISADFLNSDYCMDIEVTRALERHHAGSARVVPIILRNCDWKHSRFASLQSATQDGKPITHYTNSDDAYTEIALKLRGILGGQAAKPEDPVKPPPPPPPPPPRQRTWVAALLLVIAGLTAWWLWFIPWRELQAAQAEYDHGNLVGAREVLEAHPQRWESNAAAQFLLGVIAMRQDENQRALMYYERAARLDSRAPQYRGNLATTKLRLDDSPKSRKEAQKVFADILDGSQPFMLAAVEWLRLELVRDGGPDWPAVDARITTGNRWLRDIPAMNQPWNLNYWRFPDRSGESQRLYFNGDKDHPRDDRQCYWFALTQLARYLHDPNTPLDWPLACTESQPARAVLAADILRIKLAHPEWQAKLHEAAAEMGLPGSTDI